MFCRNCGKQVLETSELCDGCVEIIQKDVSESIDQVDVPEQNYVPFQVNLKKKISIRDIVIIFVVIVLVSLFIYGYIQSSPKVAAENFYIAYFNKDSQTVLDNFYLPKTFAAKDFVYEIKKLDLNRIDVKSLKILTTKPTGFTNYIKKDLTLNDCKTKDFKVLYMSLKVNGFEGINPVYMVKLGKKFIIFDKWVVHYGE